jgi:elongation factor G
MNSVLAYLHSPIDITNKALDMDNNEEEFTTYSDETKPAVALAFKLEDGQYGQLTYIRIYQGMVKKGSDLFNVRSRKKFKVGRLIRMHANHMEDISEAGSGDIVALFGVDCASGDTFCDPSLNVSMTSMFVPSPVISLSIKPKDKASSDKMGKALGRFIKEDPTFRSYVDEESNETIIQGMGELHLDVYVERMRREYKADVETGMPQVAYRETITARSDFNYTHKKQTGGSGQYAEVTVTIESTGPGGGYEFVDKITGGRIPKEYIPSIDAGIQEAMTNGVLAGYPTVDIRATLLDGKYHDVDSSEMAFKIAGTMVFKEAARKAKPVLLEPIMAVEVVTPEDYLGDVMGDLSSRRGKLEGTEQRGNAQVVRAQVPLDRMFGYATDLRSKTQGRANYTMQFDSYQPAPGVVQEEIVARVRGE